MSKTLMVDVSRWNGAVNFSALKNKGVKGIVIQAGYGMVASQKDPFFEVNYKNAKAHKMLVGAYLYSYAKNVKEAKKEAKVCAQWLKNKSFELPIYIDMEEAKQAKLGKTTCTKIATIFCDYLKAKGYKVGVYANADWFKNHLNYNQLKAKYSIWLAQYASNKDFDCDIWQFTSKLNIGGKEFDGNYCYKDFATSAKKAVKTKLECPLYNKKYIDKIGKTSSVIVKIPKGSTIEFIKDVGDGWSKVKYKGKTGYMVNTRINKSGLSKYKTIVVGKGSTYKRVVKGKIKYTKQLDKDREFRIICYITEGKYKGYYYMYRNLKYYLIK